MNFFGEKRRSQKFPLNRPGFALVCLAAGITVGIFGCTIGLDEETAPQSPALGEIQAQAQVQPKAPQSPPNIKEVTLEEQPFKLQELSAHEERGQTTFRMKFSMPVHQYRHFPLTQPARVVLDVFGETKGLARVENFRVDTHWVGSLRLSSGEGYLHMVMEITTASVPPYVIEPENGGLKVVIGTVQPGATAKREMQLVQAGQRSGAKVAEVKPGAPEASPQAPSGQATPTAGKKYTGQRISLDFKDADIKNVFRLLAEVSGLNIVVTGDVVKKVTVRLVDVPWDQALDLLIDTNGLGKEQVGNVVRISTAGQLKAEKDALLAAKKAEENLEPLQTAYLSVNYAKVKDLVEKIKPALSARGVVVPDDRSNTIVVRDIKKGIDEANSIVSRLDTRTPQVLIESNLIETTPTFSRALGLELDFQVPFATGLSTGQPPTGEFRTRARLDSNLQAESPFASTLGATLSILRNRVGPFRNFNAVLTAAEQEGKIKVISRPSVVTLNNVASTIQSLRILRVTLPTSTNIASGTGAAAGSAVATEKIPVGIILTVTPQVSSDGFVLMNISVKSSSLGTQSPGSVVPDELTREAISNVLVRDGETVVIGGIMKDTSQEAEAGIPYLKDIPFVGWAFRRIRWQKDFEELMVFITPRVVVGGSENLPSAEQLWREQMKKTEGG